MALAGLGAGRPRRQGAVIYEGTTIIFEEHSRHYGRRTVVKMLASTDPTAHELETIEAEYRFSRRLSDPRVRPVLARETRDGRAALILQAVEGKT